MTDESLTPEEVESLLAAVAPEEGAHQGGSPSGASKSGLREKVSVYDFKRPERVGKEQMRSLQSLHESFARNFSGALSAMLRTIVDVKLTSVDQLSYSEFVFSLENPTCFNVLSARPLDGKLVLDINPAILFPIIDRLLGGGRHAGPPARRPLTEIELRLVSRITRAFLAEMKRSWQKMIDLELEVDRVESNPQLVQIVPPNEVVVLVTFELAVGEARGMMNLCIPFNAIDRFSNRLTANTWASYGKAEATPESVQVISRHLDHARVQVVATLADSTITTADLLSLRVGDVIATEKEVADPLEISIEGVVKFRAGAGAWKGHKAFQVQDEVKGER